ncbi:MAG TPA: flagellar biosynthesis protein FlhB [Fimbriimonadaceae bacterium]|nr:flagellar biosynthesis protein FlhB [Fimbriimonadaceae bacterium]
MPEQPAGERTEEATPRRKQDARKKGTVAKSTDLAGAVSLFVAALMLPHAVDGLRVGIFTALNSSILHGVPEMSYGALLRFMSALLVPTMIAIAPMILALMVAGLATNFAQVGFVLSGESLKPTWEKVSPASGFKRLFSARTTFEGLKAVFKLFVFSWVTYAVVASQWSQLNALTFLPPARAAAVIGSVIHTILLRLAGLWLALAIVDYIFQRKQTDKQLRMTKDELKREMKEQEGSPEIKAALFHKRRKLLKGGLATRLSEADVILTNPTHFAVALKYKRNEMHAPMVVAKGQDYLALKMREIGEGLKVPIVENPPLARRLYKQCEVGDFIPRDMFAAVAEVLAYVYKSVKTARSTKGSFAA